MTNALIQKAIDAVGGQTALARRCNKKQGHVWHWLHSERVSAEAAVLIDIATGGAVPRSELRTDIFFTSEANQ